MIFDETSGLLKPALDTQLDQRRQLLTALGLGEPDQRLDAFATDLAHAADAPYAMVNLITDQQYFVGLHNPTNGEHQQVERTMPRGYGFCPVVLDRRKPLVLPDVYASPRFAGNPVVDRVGIRAYAGAPLIDPDSGVVLGTVCFVGTEPRPQDTGQATLRLIKRHRDALMSLIYAPSSHPSS